MNNIVIGNKVITPSKVVCIGRNYVDHIEELNNEMPTEPVIFIKPNSAITHEIYFSELEEIHYEGELTFLIKSGKIFAVGIGLDLTKRAIQTNLKSKGLPWERAKSFDGSAVFSEFAELGSKVEIKDITMQLYINDNLVQSANYDLMLNKPNDILNEVGKFMSFADGDLLMCGTPKGVGKICRGDVFTGKIIHNGNVLIAHVWEVQ